MTYIYARITCNTCKQGENFTLDVDSDMFDVTFADMDAFMDCNECWAKLMRD